MRTLVIILGSLLLVLGLIALIVGALAAAQSGAITDQLVRNAAERNPLAAFDFEGQRRARGEIVQTGLLVAGGGAAGMVVGLLMVVVPLLSARRRAAVAAEGEADGEVNRRPIPRTLVFAFAGLILVLAAFVARLFL